MEKMGVVMRMERKGSCALCFEGRERASGSDEPDTEMPRWPALSSPLLSSAILSLLQGVLHSGYQLDPFLSLGPIIHT